MNRHWTVTEVYPLRPGTPRSEGDDDREIVIHSTHKTFAEACAAFALDEPEHLYGRLHITEWERRGGAWIGWEVETEGEAPP